MSLKYSATTGHSQFRNFLVETREIEGIIPNGGCVKAAFGENTIKSNGIGYVYESLNLKGGLKENNKSNVKIMPIAYPK